VRLKGNKILLLFALLSLSGLAADPVIHAFESDVEYSSTECQLCLTEIADTLEADLSEIAASFKQAELLLEKLHLSSPVKGFQTRAPPSLKF
tara:strand:+ start:224 stop:499 length:276 start_codon:yes stop_codon:yes gene_type:complete